MFAVAETRAVTWHVSAGRIDLAAIGMALVLTALTSTKPTSSRPEDRWYEGGGW